MLKVPQNKAGLGLRSAHHSEVLSELPRVEWWEVHTENFFSSGGASLEYLKKISLIYPVSFHGVGLSLGSSEDPCVHHLQKLKTLVDLIEPGLISEHISWGKHSNVHTNELLPIPYNSEALGVFSKNVLITQDFLQRSILVENPSSYLQFNNSTMGEPEFIAKTIKNTGCGLLLDINNVYVSSQNNAFDPVEYIREIINLSKESIKEIHLAGHTRISDNIILDTHNKRVSDEVWKLYKFAIQNIGPVPTLIEWDGDIPDLSVLQQESAKAQNILDRFDLKESKTTKQKQINHATERATETIC